MNWNLAHHMEKHPPLGLHNVEIAITVRDALIPPRPMKGEAMKRIFIFLIILTLSACGTSEPPVEETPDISTSETVTITIEEDDMINADYLRDIIASDEADVHCLNLLPKETLESLADYIDGTEEELAPGKYEIDPAWHFEGGSFFDGPSFENGVAKESEIGFEYRPMGHISPDGSTLIRTRYEDDEHIYKWDGWYIDIVSLDGSFRDYYVSTAAPRGLCWLSDRYFIYGAGKGAIFVYDLYEGKTSQLTSISYEIEAVEDGKIILDDANDSDNPVIEYSFADDGSVVINSHIELYNEPWTEQWSEVEKNDAVR